MKRNLFSLSQDAWFCYFLLAVCAPCLRAQPQYERRNRRLKGGDWRYFSRAMDPLQQQVTHKQEEQKEDQTEQIVSKQIKDFQWIRQLPHATAGITQSHGGNRKLETTETETTEAGNEYDWISTLEYYRLSSETLTPSEASSMSTVVATSTSSQYTTATQSTLATPSPSPSQTGTGTLPSASMSPSPSSTFSASPLMNDTMSTPPSEITSAPSLVGSMNTAGLFLGDGVYETAADALDIADFSSMFLSTQGKNSKKVKVSACRARVPKNILSALLSQGSSKGSAKKGSGSKGSAKKGSESKGSASNGLSSIFGSSSKGSKASKKCDKIFFLIPIPRPKRSRTPTPISSVVPSLLNLNEDYVAEETDPSVSYRNAEKSPPEQLNKITESKQQMEMSSTDKTSMNLTDNTNLTNVKDSPIYQLSLSKLFRGNGRRLDNGMQEPSPLANILLGDDENVNYNAIVSHERHVEEQIEAPSDAEPALKGISNDALVPMITFPIDEEVHPKSETDPSILYSVEAAKKTNKEPLVMDNDAGSSSETMSEFIQQPPSIKGENFTFRSGMKSVTHNSFIEWVARHAENISLSNDTGKINSVDVYFQTEVQNLDESLASKNASNIVNKALIVSINSADVNFKTNNSNAIQSLPREKASSIAQKYIGEPSDEIRAKELSDLLSTLKRLETKLDMPKGISTRPPFVTSLKSLDEPSRFAYKNKYTSNYQSKGKSGVHGSIFSSKGQSSKVHCLYIDKSIAANTKQIMSILVRNRVKGMSKSNSSRTIGSKGSSGSKARKSSKDNKKRKETNTGIANDSKLASKFGKKDNDTRYPRYPRYPNKGSVSGTGIGTIFSNHTTQFKNLTCVPYFVPTKPPRTDEPVPTLNPTPSPTRLEPHTKRPTQTPTQRPSQLPSAIITNPPTRLATTQRPTQFPSPIITNPPTRLATIPASESPINQQSTVTSASPTTGPPGPTKSPTISSAPTAEPVQVQLLPEYYIAYVALGARSPTDEEYQLMLNITTDYFTSVFESHFANTTETNFLRVENTLLDTAFELGVPEPRYNIFMSYTMNVIFTQDSVAPPIPDTFRIVTESINPEYITEWVRTAVGTPFEGTTEVYCANLPPDLVVQIKAYGTKMTRSNGALYGLTLRENPLTNNHLTPMVSWGDQRPS